MTDTLERATCRIIAMAQLAMNDDRSTDAEKLASIFDAVKAYEGVIQQSADELATTLAEFHAKADDADVLAQFDRNRAGR